MIQKLYGLLLLCLISVIGAAQTKNSSSSIQAIGVGDSLPSVLLEQVMNSNQSSMHTKDFKGKMLILDFWATWCSPCVSLMPKMDSLQQVFQDQVRILPVTYQSKEEVQKLLSKAPKLKNLSLPIVHSDNILRTFFPHRELPHYVWIDPVGKVIAITGYDQITADTIRMMLDKTSPRLKTKKDVFKPYDREKSMLFQALDFQESDVQFQSLITGFKEGVNTRLDVIRRPDHSIKKVTVLNGYLKFLFRIAWSDDTRFFSSSRIVMEVKDSTQFVSSEKGDSFRDWLKDHAWSYELIVPPHLSKNAFTIMRTDMERFFQQYRVSIEKQLRPCLVLVRTTTEDKIKSKGGSREEAFDQFGILMQNCHINLLISQLGFFYQKSPRPVIDATGYNDYIDLKLIANVTNLQELSQALRAYGLDLVEKDYEIEMLVIRDSQ